MNEDFTPYTFYVFSDATLMDCIREFGNREYPVKFIPYERNYFTHPLSEEKFIYSYAAAKFQHLVVL